MDAKIAGVFRGIFGDIDSYTIGTTALGVFDGASGAGTWCNVPATASILVSIDEFEFLILFSGDLNVVDRE